jgi:threonine/homoserine/homoserine lactone efflux protein
VGGYGLQGLAYGLAAAAQPGPFQTYIISRTLRYGWRRTLVAALAPLLSDGPIIALSVLVLSSVPAWLERGLSIAGGVLTIYFAWTAFASWRSFPDRSGTQEPAESQGVLQAALMNALGPGPWVFWALVAGPVLVQAWRDSPALAIGFLGGFYAAMIGTLAALILLFGTVRRLGPVVARALLAVSAVALLGFGILQLVRGIVP